MECLAHCFQSLSNWYKIVVLLLPKPAKNNGGRIVTVDRLSCFPNIGILGLDANIPLWEHI
ncbi:hypothetical protein T4B_4161 [Trichinella pseudospiralis]|uniref:Uncharacterized protein n=1 Tax=Trichinella pseudospiralis TaxID=6337 RepID=A0A0V1EJB9_TRIPS|nr:hypothetical protein T4A_12986 [Trichinella pseudospiralis]KRZ08696.1 hypothetical protein T4B_4161 [Trichinella pseudospiralis]KRZ28848.1 hypothetical protein T4C_8431 [Trichinella pseudospiralis]